MENAIMINKSMPTFKGKALNTATKVIFDAVNKYNATATETRKTVAVTLARVEKNKTYAEDGFKSLADYAAKIGLEKSLAHKLENAGRLLDSEVPAVKEFAAAADYSKLAILASAPVDDLKAAINSGELTAATSQADVKAWKANNAAKNTPAKVLPNYEVHITFGNGSTLDYDSISLEAIDRLDGFVKVGTFKPENGDTLIFMYNPATCEQCRYTAVKVKAAPKAKKPAALNLNGFTDEMLKAAMEEYARRQAANEDEGE